MGSRSRATLVVFGLAVGVAGCGGSDHKATPATAEAAPATVAFPPGSVAFRRYIDPAHNHGAIFTVGTDGSGEKQVTSPPEDFVDDLPDWSPDGKLIAFQRCQEGASAGDAAVKGFAPCTIWTVDPSEGEAHRVRIRCELKGRCDASAPAWTPDARLVVTLDQGRVRTLDGDFNQLQQSSAEEIDPRTGKQRTIYRRGGWTGDVGQPAVSPDGRTLLYSRRNSPRAKPPTTDGLFAVGMDGSGHHQVTPWKLGGGDHPGFAPDGVVVFRSYEEDETQQSQLFTVRLDGTHLRQLTHFKQGTLVLSTSASPDGKWIVYGTKDDRTVFDSDLSVISADGGAAGEPLVDGKQWDSAPDWGP